MDRILRGTVTSSDQQHAEYRAFIERTYSIETLIFLRQYLEFNIDCRNQFLMQIASMYGSLLEKGRNISVPDRSLGKVLCMEALAKVMTTIEEFAVFCIAFRGDLKDLPSKVVGYSTDEALAFYRELESKPDSYFKEIWDYNGSTRFNQLSLDDQRLLNKVTDKNVQNIKRLLLLARDFREKYGRVHNKYKHSSAILTDFDAVAHGTLPKGYDVLVTCVDERSPLEKVRGVLIGQVPLERYLRLQSELSDKLKDLIKRRTLQVDWEGSTFPPYELYFKQESEYTPEEIERYHSISQKLTPKRRKTFPLEFNANPVHLENDLRWFESATIWEPIFEDNKK